MNGKRIVALVFSAVLMLGIMSGCGTKAEQKPADAAKPKVDAVTTASLVDNQEAFLKGASKSGTWIISILKDLTIDKEIVLEGNFKNGKKDAAGKEIIQRKIALYTQDEKHVVTARFTLKAPKLTVMSENASIQHGTFEGDVYVQAKGFALVDNKVVGNIYFASEEFKSTFKMDDKSSVTGVQEVKK